MMRFSLSGSAALVSVLATSLAAGEEPATYLLRYKFTQGETLRWDVVHRGRIDATVSGSTKTTETVSKSIKAWRVKEITPDGSAVFEHSVEYVDMWHRLTDCAPVRYDSRKDAKPPRAFEQAAQRVGKPLCQITLDNRGKILGRKELIVGPAKVSEGEITMPLPEDPVAVGQTWSEKHDVTVPLETGGVKKILTLQKYALKDVRTGVATIEVATQILTPIDDPAIEAKLIERGSRGTVRFDVDAGRVLSQRMDLDKRVVGFRGAGSALNYLTRFTEQLLPVEGGLARRDRS
ncbi:MAG: hypothetical protein JW809_10030 [Pirellulales bacterium]|nr:hypothetical protein [Pirellulales bacterium]